MTNGNWDIRITKNIKAVNFFLNVYISMCFRKTISISLINALFIDYHLPSTFHQRIFTSLLKLSVPDFTERFGW